MAQSEQAMKEAFRVLKAGGRYLMTISGDPGGRCVGCTAGLPAYLAVTRYLRVIAADKEPILREPSGSNRWRYLTTGTFPRY